MRRSCPILTTALCEVALCDPGSSPVRSGRKLCERVLRLGESFLGLVEPVLLQQRATKHQACVADLIQLVLA